MYKRICCHWLKVSPCRIYELHKHHQCEQMGFFRAILQYLWLICKWIHCQQSDTNIPLHLWVWNCKVDLCPLLPCQAPGLPPPCYCSSQSSLFPFLISFLTLCIPVYQNHRDWFKLSFIGSIHEYVWIYSCLALKEEKKKKSFSNKKSIVFCLWIFFFTFQREWSKR